MKETRPSTKGTLGVHAKVGGRRSEGGIVWVRARRWREWSGGGSERIAIGFLGLWVTRERERGASKQGNKGKK